MMLRAAFVPPEPVVAELRRLSGRLSSLPGMTATPPDRLDVPVVGFGNVVDSDLRRLSRVLAARLVDEPAPVVRFAGIDVDRDGDVLVPLTGEVNRVRNVARLVGQVAASVNLYVDRRGFRAALPVGVLTGLQPGSALPGRVRAMPPWSGMEWEAAGISLIRTRWSAGGEIAEEVDFIDLGRPLDVAWA